MPVKNMPSRVKKLLFTSVWPIALFFIIPVFTIINLRLRLPVSGNLLLINNGCFALLMGLRFVWCLFNLRSDFRYGADQSVPKNALALDRPASQLRTKLAGAGYRFDAGGQYGEKRDLGYLGKTLLYGGVMLLLVFGSYDYMREYSIMVRLGVGLPFPLDGKGLTGQYEAGALAATSALPLLQIKQQILPNQQWPKGATDIALVSKDGKVLTKTTLSPGKPFSYGGLEYHMIKFLFDGLIVIKEGKYIILDEFLKFLPMPQKKGPFSYHAPMISSQSKVRGEAWLNPEKKEVQVAAKLDDKQIVTTDLELWGEHAKTQGEYRTSFDGLAQWSEIRVSRGRHTGMLLVGALLALAGGLLRFLVRPQRVWLEEEGESSRVRVCGAGTKRLIGGLAE